MHETNPTVPHSPFQSADICKEQRVALREFGFFFSDLPASEEQNTLEKHSLLYQLTAGSRLVEQLIVAQMVKKFLLSYETR
jgi:hypothetical protein